MPDVTVMADYHCSPLWTAGAGSGMNPSVDAFSLSDSLKNELQEWAECFDRTLDREDPSHSGFRSPQETQVFESWGLDLARRLEAETDDSVVVWYKGCESARPVRVSP